ncbi:MAG: hypothetical protein AAGJ46_17325 [Planctomycetota bacterium]
MDASLHLKLTSVPGLQKGRIGAHEAPPVSAASLADLQAVTPHLPPVVADLAMVQWACGMRPGEACRIRRSEIDQSGTVWLWSPGKHKTANRRKLLVKAIPELAQPHLERWFSDDADYVFRHDQSTRIARQREMDRPSTRKTKVFPSEAKRVAARKAERAN